MIRLVMKNCILCVKIANFVALQLHIATLVRTYLPHISILSVVHETFFFIFIQYSRYALPAEIFN